MSMLWKQDDWEIHLNDSGSSLGTGLCLRHIDCTAMSNQIPKGGGGRCSCEGKCYICKLKVPDEVKGFFELVKWKR